MSAHRQNYIPMAEEGQGLALMHWACVIGAVAVVGICIVGAINKLSQRTTPTAQAQQPAYPPAQYLTGQQLADLRLEAFRAGLQEAQQQTACAALAAPIALTATPTGTTITRSLP